MSAKRALPWDWPFPPFNILSPAFVMTGQGVRLVPKFLMSPFQS